MCSGGAAAEMASGAAGSDGALSTGDLYNSRHVMTPHCKTADRMMPLQFEQPVHFIATSNAGPSLYRLAMKQCLRVLSKCV